MTIPFSHKLQARGQDKNETMRCYYFFGFRSFSENSLPVVVEFDKSESVFDDDIAEAAVRLEEFFDVSLTGRGCDIAEEHACAGRHL